MLSLSRHPEVRAEVQAGVRSALGDRTLTAADLRGLPLPNACIQEPLRLSPPERRVEGGRTPEAFLPFGAGARMCIGNHLALMEAGLIAALVLRDFDLEVPVCGPTGLVAGVTLKPDGVVRGRVRGLQRLGGSLPSRRTARSSARPSHHAPSPDPSAPTPAQTSRTVAAPRGRGASGPKPRLKAARPANTHAISARTASPRRTRSRSGGMDAS